MNPEKDIDCLSVASQRTRGGDLPITVGEDTQPLRHSFTPAAGKRRKTTSFKLPEEPSLILDKPNIHNREKGKNAKNVSNLVFHPGIIVKPTQVKVLSHRKDDQMSVLSGTNEKLFSNVNEPLTPTYVQAKKKPASQRKSSLAKPRKVVVVRRKN